MPVSEQFRRLVLAQLFSLNNRLERNPEYRC